MRYLVSLVILFFLTTLYAQELYPKLFSKQGTPLYKAMLSFGLTDDISLMKTSLNTYVTEAKKVKELGFKADESNEKEDIKVYFKSLRVLQIQHDELVGLSTKLLYKSIQQDKYEEFTKMIDFGLSYYDQKPKLREKILSFYQSNRDKSKVPSLEKMLKYDAGITKSYDETEYVFSKDLPRKAEVTTDKNIILLSMKGCSWCKKVKKLLDRSGKSYRELNVKNSEGSRLFKKYNGQGVPMLIVNNRVIRGYSPNKILAAIE